MPQLPRHIRSGNLTRLHSLILVESDTGVLTTVGIPAMGNTMLALRCVIPGSSWHMSRAFLADADNSSGRHLH